MKNEIEFLKFKKQSIENEKVKDEDNHINLINSLRKNPDYIRYVKPKDQTVHMTETILRERINYGNKTGYHDFRLFNYCNHKLINESLILELMPIINNINDLKSYLYYVPKHCLTKSFFNILNQKEYLELYDTLKLKEFFM